MGDCARMRVRRSVLVLGQRRDSARSVGRCRRCGWVASAGRAVPWPVARLLVDLVQCRGASRRFVDAPCAWSIVAWAGGCRSLHGVPRAAADDVAPAHEAGGMEPVHSPSRADAGCRVPRVRGTRVAGMQVLLADHAPAPAYGGCGCLLLPRVPSQVCRSYLVFWRRKRRWGSSCL